MCGIIGYIGHRQALPILLEGLKRLEYRGYDSVGICIGRASDATTVKTVGRIDDLVRKVSKTKNVTGMVGVGHCLLPETLIQLYDGRVKQISTLVDGDEVFCLDYKTLKFTRGRARVSRHESPESVYEVRTSSCVLTASERHRFLVSRLGEITEIPASELKKGDLLLVPKILARAGVSAKMRFSLPPVKRYYSMTDRGFDLIRVRARELALSRQALATRAGLSSESYAGHILDGNRKVRHDQLIRVTSLLDVPLIARFFVPRDTTHGKLVTLPRKSSPELMRILGYFVGDGTARSRTVRFKDLDKGVLLEYGRLMHRVFGLKSRVVAQADTRAYLLEVNSSYFARWLMLNVVGRKTQFVSELGRLSNKELSSFFKGIFDAEGCVAQDARQVVMATTDAYLMRSLQMYLLRFGILASLSRHERRQQTWRTSWKLSISNLDAVRLFATHIGVTSRSKQKRLANLINTLSPGLNFCSKVIPLTRREILESLSMLSGQMKRDLKTRGLLDYTNTFIGARKARELLTRLGAYEEKSPRVRQIRRELDRFVNGEVFYQSVISTKRVRSPSRVLYDLELEPHANFVANGIVTHNSRWATHGPVTEQNAHPHSDCEGGIWLVHNGIIENYLELKSYLQKQGHVFASETDTEVLAHLIEEFMSTHKFEDAVRAALSRAKGAYACVVWSRTEPEMLVAGRVSSPLLIGVGEGEHFLASDASAVVDHTKRVVYLDDGEMAIVTPEKYTIRRFDATEVAKSVHEIDWTIEQAQKGGFPHFMLKEIMEQPEALVNTLRGRLRPDEGLVRLGGLEEVKDRLREAKRIIIVACGTAYYAGLVGEYMIEEYAGVPCEVELASEFRYRKPLLDPGTVVIAISQSGETADTLAAVREAKQKGALTLGIVNVVGSTIARETDAGVYNHAGPEIGVASTKAFSSQLAVLTMLTVMLGRQRAMSYVMGRRIVDALRTIPDLMRQVLIEDKLIDDIAKKYHKAVDVLYLGRKYNFPIALEGALKLKEISYIHSEGYSAGEMKHGPIALLDKKFPVVAIAPQDSVYEKMLSNIEEVKTRHARVFAIGTAGDKKLAKLAHDVVFIPKTLEMLTPFLSVLPLQLFAYHVGVLRGCDVDKPRNLAKSVTVE